MVVWLEIFQEFKQLIANTALTQDIAPFPLVSDEAALCCIPSAAGGTAVGPWLACVNTQVPLHVAGLREVTATVDAPEGLFTGVHTHVVCELVTVGKALSTADTAKRFLARVHTLVALEVCHLVKNFTA